MSTAVLDSHQPGAAAEAEHTHSVEVFGECMACRRALIDIAAEHAPLPAPVHGKLRAHPTPAERRAAGSVKAGSQQHALLWHLCAAPDGLTAYEAAPLMGMSANQAAARMLELRERGLAEWKVGALLDQSDSDGLVVRETTPGNYGRVHWPTDRGRTQATLGVPPR